MSETGYLIESTVFFKQGKEAFCVSFTNPLQSVQHKGEKCGMMAYYSLNEGTTLTHHTCAQHYAAKRCLGR